MEKVSLTEMEAHKARKLFSKLINAKEERMAYPVPTRAFLQPSPEAAMLFAPFGCTHPPPPVLPFLPAQNPNSKYIAGSNITSTKSKGLSSVKALYSPDPPLMFT